MSAAPRELGSIYYICPAFHAGLSYFGPPGLVCGLPRARYGPGQSPLRSL